VNYLDHAATTPVIPEVRELMLAFLREGFGNPSSVHAAGREARSGVEEARERMATAIGAASSEIVFTGGGTEADNLAIKGALRKLRGNGNHLVTTAFEHHAVLDTCSWMVHQGFEQTVVQVPPSGVVDPEAIVEAVRPDTLLVSVMAVNNEIGTIQPIAEIVRAVRQAAPNAVIHTDAVQALPNVEVDVRGWGVDLAAFAAHKIGGPKGVGALYVRSGVAVEPLLHGGGQERGLRSGTLNVAGIAGMGLAAEIVTKEIEVRRERLGTLRDALLAGIRAQVPDVVVNGEMERRVASNLNISIPGTHGETLILLLDRSGIACSSGSACQSGALDPSHVLAALGVDETVSGGSLRFSLGRDSNKADIEAVLEALPSVVTSARKAA
jgi:cysteine desulfurase